MSVGFTTLFERSRYASNGRLAGLDVASKRQRMEQHERFVGGVVGFALNCDSEFRSHFLVRVFGLSGQTGSDNWQVEVEPGNWGDLVLKHRGLGILAVAELKLGAKIRKHQNPSQTRFRLPARDAQPAGYGWEIEQAAKKGNWADCRYVTLGKNSLWAGAPKKVGNVACGSREWDCLLRGKWESESQVERQVYNCLGHFGIYTFTARNMNEIKLAERATQPLALLIGVLAESGREFSARRLAVGADYLGVNITADDLPEVAKIIRPDNGIVGWFGYEADEPLGPRLSVWFYCYRCSGNKAAARKTIERKLQRAGLGSRIFKDEPSANTGVFCKAEESEGDKEWFLKVLESVRK